MVPIAGATRRGWAFVPHVVEQDASLKLLVIPSTGSPQGPVERLRVKALAAVSDLTGEN